MKKPLLAIGLTVALLSTAAFTVVSAEHIAYPTPKSGPVAPTPTGAIVNSKPVAPLGLPGPRHVPTVYGMRAVQPPVTEAAVLAYIAQGKYLPAVALQKPVVSKIEFLTVSSMGQRFNVEISYYPPTAQVVYVALEGQFSLPSEAKDAPTIQLPHGFMVFDATTGNLISDGAR
ncbi:MAG: hypothetical protein M3Z04_00490 [Chloroflexota bacterium]|nr:hypothetical protein [Chloroflexota bacterium]